MRKIAFIAMGLLVGGALFSQEVLRNPATPSNPYFGRSLALEPVFAFDDSAGGFFLKNPHEIRVDSRGFFYILEFDPSQLWKFSPEGKFLDNLVKTGQGPGEIDGSRVASVVIRQDEVYLSDGHTKIIHFDKDGRLVGEFRTNRLQPFQLLAVSENGYYVARTNTDWHKSGPVDVDNEILYLPADGKDLQRVAGFVTQRHAEWRANGGTGSKPLFRNSNRSNFYPAVDPDDLVLYASHTTDYLIEKVDLAGRRALASFSREYARVKMPASSPSPDNRLARFRPPPKDYRDDITGLFVCDHNLWVGTSTFSEDGGQLFDVFDPQGRYVDSFNLRGFAGHHLCPVSGGYFYTLRRSADLVWTVRKYKVLNGPKPFAPSQGAAAPPPAPPRDCQGSEGGNL